MGPLATIRAHIKERGDTLLKRTSAFIGLVLIFFVAFGGVSHHERWLITNIRISGATIVSDDGIRSFIQQEITGNYFLVYARDNSLIFPKQEIERAVVEKFPRLEAVVASRIDDHTIAIQVTERKPYALWCGDEFNAEVYELSDCWFIDSNGFVFDHAPVYSQGVYLETYGALEHKNGDDPVGGQIPASRFKAIDSFSQTLREQIGDPLRATLLSDGEFEIVIYKSSAYPMLVRTALKIKDEMPAVPTVRNLLAALKEEFPDNTPKKSKLLYVDLRFGNKIFFGFEN